MTLLLIASTALLQSMGADLDGTLDLCGLISITDPKLPAIKWALIHAVGRRDRDMLLREGETERDPGFSERVDRGIHLTVITGERGGIYPNDSHWLDEGPGRTFRCASAPMPREWKMLLAEDSADDRLLISRALGANLYLVKSYNMGETLRPLIPFLASAYAENG